MIVHITVWGWIGIAVFLVGFYYSIIVINTFNALREFCTDVADNFPKDFLNLEINRLNEELDDFYKSVNATYVFKTSLFVSINSTFVSTMQSLCSKYDLKLSIEKEDVNNYSNTLTFIKNYGKEIDGAQSTGSL